MKSSLDMIFYKIVYHHIIYMCDFFLLNLDDFFTVVCTNFHEGCSFHQICSKKKNKFIIPSNQNYIINKHKDHTSHDLTR